MPRIKDIPGPYRVFFTSFDCNEPAPVHVERDDATCKFMNTAAASIEPRIHDAHVTGDEIVARLVDGRVISVPLAWSWRLSDATPQQRAHFRLIGSGQGIHWPDVDEDISVEGMLRGVPARRPESTTSLASGKGARRPDAPSKRIQPTRGQRRVRTGGRGARS